jgi:acetolactate synthase-1/3 small subunit|tara:strand:+ start:260 stop:793 length:534 start_codon:yes stop_codon:yes gene_type:complete
MSDIDENNSSSTPHTIAILVENKFGVLAKVSSLFSARGYNIESLSVGTTQDPSVSRITIVTSGDSRIVEQIRKQLGKLIDTIKVTEMKYRESIQREMVLMKVLSSHQTRGEILQIADIFHCKILQITPNEIILETTGDEEKINNLIELLQPYRISEISRTGKTAISKGSIILKNIKN